MAGIRVSTFKSEAMVLSRKKVDCPLQVESKLLHQAEEFKNLEILFMIEGRLEYKFDRMWSLY